MDTHEKWLHTLTGGASGRAAAQKAEISVATLNRQLKAGRLSAENVIALARAYNESPVQALAATGYLSSEEAIGVSLTTTAQMLSDKDLIRELARRVDSTPGVWQDTFDATVSSATEQPKHSNKRSIDVLPRIYNADHSSIAATADSELPLTPDGYLDIGREDLDLVADTSPEEPTEGDDDYGSGA
ncbi:hypothetical protein [Corynebacterium sp. TAE3-ERU2]|uniref:hypothetical protein n=1 Tax=Corynebacterium sp. TAE3-ERU2 TaxID=2849497 RepID=UPI001C451156|nr:hypothetical protein [Corynebacterium sp. TAE3-ERU2]MBV7302915.1 hypothetical protein [Corynebacterium sp. TAE3-ERU2]